MLRRGFLGTWTGAAASLAAFQTERKMGRLKISDIELAPAQIQRHTRVEWRG